MRKLFVAVAALGMLLTSCAKDADVVTGGNESMVTINVAQPELSTRAATGSHDATQTYGTGVAAEDLQYAIFEVKGNENQYRFDRDKAGFFEGEALEGTLTERLVNGKTYIAVFWADAAMDKYYTVDWENGTISLNDATALNAQNEELDAFWGMTDEFTVNGPVTVSATLKRPFAQLNISTCDTDVAADAGLVVEKSSLTVSKVYTAFNFWSGEVDANSETAIEFKSAAIPDSYYYDIGNTKYDVLSLNYLLVNDKKTVDVVFQYEGSGLDFEREFTSVPVQRNHRTHILGNLLTDVATINIEIDPMFEDPDHLVDADLLHAFQYGGAVELTRDVVLSAPLEMLNDVETTINLNGHNITYANPDEDAYTAVFMVKKGTLTIEGEGDVVAEGVGNIAVWAGRGDAENDGKVIINGGNFSNTTSQELIYTNNKGVIKIYGGTFQVAEEDDKSFAEPQYPVLNLYGNGKTGNDIIVYGGTFYNFNPADNVSENPKKNFVAGGYASIASTDAEGNNIYTVVEAKEMEGLTVAALGYQNAKLSWTAVDGADHYKVSYGTWTSDKITGTEYADMPAETVKDSRKPVFQVVAYDANGSTLAMGKTAGDVEIFTLFERPEPKITLANGKLTLANAEMYNTNPTKDWVNFGGAILDNIHLYGILLEAKIEFYKDGAAAPTYIAEGGFVETTALSSPHGAKNWSHVATSATEGKFKNNIAMYYNAWKWNGATEATVTAPAFEPGNYTVKYVAYYYPIVGGSYGQDRVLYAANTGMLQQKIAREGEVEGSFSIASVEGIAAARNGYKGIEVTWTAVQGATSYEVVADGQKSTVSEAKAQFTAADTQHSFTNFSVTALDANGAVVAVGSLAAETKVWNIDGVQPLTYTFDGSKLVVSGANNLVGTAVHVKVEFVKDGTVVHTAEMDKTDVSDYGASSNYNTAGAIDNADYNGARYGRLTNVMFADFPGTNASNNNAIWKWDGNTTPSAAPAFEPGDYTVNYTAYYYPIVDAFWSKSGEWDPTKYDETSGNRVAFKTADILTEKIEVKGSFDNYVVGFKAKAAIYDSLEAIPFGEKKGQKAVGGIYQGAKLTWNPAGASYDVYYKESTAAEFTKAANVTDANYTFAEGTLPARKYDFKVVALNASNAEIATAEASTDIYTMTGAAITFKALEQADGTWKIYSYGVSGENYCFNQFEFSIYEEGGSTAVVTDSKNKGNDNVNNAFNIWPGTRSVATYREITNSDYDDHSDKEPWAANTFDKSKKYVVKYTLKARPQIFTEWKVVNATDAGYGFSSMLWELRTLGEQTAELEIVPAQ